MSYLKERITACQEKHAGELEKAKLALAEVEVRINNDIRDVMVETKNWRAPVKYCVLVEEVRIEDNYPSYNRWYSYYLTYPGHAGRVKVPDDSMRKLLTNAVGTSITQTVEK